MSTRIPASLIGAIVAFSGTASAGSVSQEQFDLQVDGEVVALEANDERGQLGLETSAGKLSYCGSLQDSLRAKATLFALSRVRFR
jgi:hypothetical protein